MLELIIPDIELWDSEKEEFVYKKGQILQLEHSLLSLSKWEAHYQKPFLSRDEKTIKETIDYIKCMSLSELMNPDIYDCLTDIHLKKVEQYIENPMTATTFSKEFNRRNNGEQITAELIYYWMISLGIPFECASWHLNRLLTLIRVCTIKNQPKKQRSARDIMRRNTSVNSARRKKYNTRG